jgi:hypothetical protein
MPLIVRRFKESPDDHPVATALLVLGATGGVTGAAITAALWLLPNWNIGIPLLALVVITGGLVGAIIAIAIGSGLVKEAWEGPLAALLITAALMPFVNAVMFVIFLSIGGGTH